MPRPPASGITSDELGYRVGDLVIDIGRQRVTRAEAEIPLSRRSFDFLLALARAAPNLLTFDQLLERVWPGVVVGSEAISQRVKVVRDALGDSAQAPRYIAGVRGRGYRIVAPVSRCDPRSLPEAAVGPAAAPAEAAASPAPRRRARRWRSSVAIVLVLVAAGAWLGLQPRDAGEPRPKNSGTRHALLRSAGEPSRGPPSREALAAAHLRRASFFFNRRGAGDIERAKDYYERALALAPNQATAWTGLAGVYSIERAQGDIDPKIGLARQREAAEKAIALDPKLAEAHVRLAQYLVAVGRLDASAEEFRRALALDPDNPLVLSNAAGLAAGQGRLERAIELQQRVVLREPASYVHRGNLAVFLLAAGRLQEAKAQALIALELSPTPTESGVEGTSLHRDIVLMMLLQGQFEQALAATRRWPHGPDRDHCLALIYHGIGRKADADAALERLIARPGAPEVLRVAEVYAYRGEIDKAFEWIARATDQVRRQASARLSVHERLMDLRTELRLSPLLRPLRDDPRWEERLAAAG